jgi:hypothetical protein
MIVLNSIWLWLQIWEMVIVGIFFLGLAESAGEAISTGCIYYEVAGSVLLLILLLYGCAAAFIVALTLKHKSELYLKTPLHESWKLVLANAPMCPLSLVPFAWHGKTEYYELFWGAGASGSSRVPKDVFFRQARTYVRCLVNSKAKGAMGGETGRNCRSLCLLSALLCICLCPCLFPYDKPLRPQSVDPNP